MIEIVSAVAAAYIITVVVTGSSLLARPRAWLIARTPWLQPVPDHPHFIECRLCVGFWIALAVTLVWGLAWHLFFVVYGLSYFMATQER